MSCWSRCSRPRRSGILSDVTRWPVIVLAALTACASTHEARYGRVLAPRSVDASRGRLVADALDRQAPSVAEFLGVSVDHEITVRLSEEERVTNGALGAVMIKGKKKEIYLSTACFSYPGWLDEVLAHELTHWYIADRGVPHAVEEGLAMLVGLFYLPRSSPDAYVGSFHGEIDLAVLDLTKDQLQALPMPERERASLMGFAIVRGIGFVRVREMVQAGLTSPKDFEAALEQAKAALNDMDAPQPPRTVKKADASPEEPAQACPEGGDQAASVPGGGALRDGRAAARPSRSGAGTAAPERPRARAERPGSLPAQRRR